MIHFKFASVIEPDVLRISGGSIQVSEFIENVMENYKLTPRDCRIEVYYPTSDAPLDASHKLVTNTSVVLKRLPAIQQYVWNGNRRVRRIPAKRKPQNEVNGDYVRYLEKKNGFKMHSYDKRLVRSALEYGQKNYRK